MLQRFGYTYDAGGSRRSEQIDDVVTGATYDSRNRLLAHSATGPLRIAGTLNEAGTVTIDGQPAAVDAANAFEGSKNVSAGTNLFTVAATDSSGNSAIRSFEVPATGNSRTFTHDANGNLTSDGTRTFEWDAENRLIAVVNGTHRSEFTSDGYSRRVRIVEKENGVATRDAVLHWSGARIIEERVNTGEVNRFFDEGEQHNGAARYLTRDHLDSIREVTDATGTLKTRNEYDPYGRATRTSGTEDSRFAFTGHYVHSASGLLLTLYRAYDPGAARWLSEDPLGLRGGTARYAYVEGNPLRYIDPLGLCEEPDKGGKKRNPLDEAYRRFAQRDERTVLDDATPDIARRAGPMGEAKTYALLALASLAGAALGPAEVVASEILLATTTSIEVFIVALGGTLGGIQRGLDAVQGLFPTIPSTVNQVTVSATQKATGGFQ